MNRLSLDATLKRLTHACYASGGLLTISLGVLLIQGFSSKQSTHAANEMTLGMQKRLQEDQEKIEKAKNLKGVLMTDGLQAAGTFQARFEAQAKKHNIEMAEFRSGTDLMPFLSSYAKDTANDGWSQIECRCTMRGKLADLMSTLKDVSREGIPFEFDSIELTRVLGEPGAILVTANVGMRVLTKASGVKK